MMLFGRNWVRSLFVGLLVWAFCISGGASGSYAANDPAFAAWIKKMEVAAQEAGISEKTIDQALGSLTLEPDVVELDRKQPETRQTFEQYRARVLSKSRVEKGRKLLKEHRELLNRVAADYGVQPRFIVSLWGIETSYGAFLGGHHVIQALATLAYDGRRAELFERELISALRIVDRGDIKIEDMKGSWAGAMGQSQFMPSSFLRFAVDYDGDGRRDIWTSLPDVFASIANYLSKSGWNDQYTWGRPVRLAAAGKSSGDTGGLKVVKSLPEWQSLGVRRKNGRNLPAVALNASLLHTDDGAGPAYLVYDNFRVLMIWNRSTYFALTVSELSDLIKS
ncbi:MAG: lytic murein transglycosylase [Pseudomonadota bacterium]